MESTDYTYIVVCTCMCIELQLFFLCELSFGLNETLNPGGYTPSIKAGQGGCKRKILVRRKGRRNYERNRGGDGTKKKRYKDR